MLSSSRKRKVRAVILSTEMMLLLTAVIALAVAGFFGMSKLVLAQATSPKKTLIIDRAEAYSINDQAVSVSLFVQNTGSEDVIIKYAGIQYQHSNSGIPYMYDCHIDDSQFPDITVHPGESKVISYSIANNGATSGGCGYVNDIHVGDDIVVYVHLSDGSNVGTAVKVVSP